MDPLCFVHLFLFSVCTDVSLGQRTAKSSCPYSDNKCDGVPPLTLEHNHQISSLGTAVRDLLSWKEEIQNQHNKEIKSLTEKITALQNESKQGREEVQNQHNKETTSLNEKITALKNESKQGRENIQNQHNKEITSLNQEITALKKESSALKKEIAVLNESKQDIYPENCAEIYKLGIKTSGVYTLSIKGQEIHSVPVYCDMDTTTGGWTVFQRRQDGSVPFNRNWEEYKHGFGKLESEFWLGNQWISMMTASNTRYILRVDLESFSNEKRYAEYQDFKVSSESDKYRLNIGSYSGTAGDGGQGLSYSNQSQFSTKDEDNDGRSGVNCALKYGGGGGFWYRYCDHANINGVYTHTAVVDHHGINWYAWLQHTTLKHTEMKLKPIQ